MSQSKSLPNDNHTQLHHQLKSLIPSLSRDSHKGQAGRTCIVGGSQSYTGAPYFASMTTYKLGADLVTVLCSVDSAVPIKSYSPELMTRPTLIPRYLASVHGVNENAGPSKSDSEIVSGIARTVKSEVIEKINVLIVGPGLGKDELVVQSVNAIIKLAQEQLLPVIVDGDGIHVVLTYPDTIRNYSHAILTPNAAEFRRLYQKFLPNKNPPSMSLPVDQSLVERIEQSKHTLGGYLELTDKLCADTVDLANAMGGVTIVRKGPIDIISDGHQALYVALEGAPRRCGGQGDVLTGAIGIVAAWNYIRQQKANDGDKDSSSDQRLKGELLAAYGGCVFVRQSAALSFQAHGRSMLASHLVDNMEQVIENWVPVKQKPSAL